MRKTFIMLAFFFVASSYVSAEKITMEMVRSQTLQNNPSIAAAKYELNMAKQTYRSFLSSFLPDVNFLASLSERDGGFTIVSDGGKGNKRYDYGLNAKISLFSGFSDYNKMKSLSAKVKAAEESYRRAVCDAVCDAYSAYVNLMYTYESIDLYKKIHQRKIESRDLVNLRYHSGNIDLGSLKRSEADVKMTEYNLEKTQRAVETASQILLTAIGRNDEVTILETDEKINVDKEIISKPDFDNLISKIPEFLIGKYTLDSFKALNWTQKGQWLPKVDFNGNISHRRFDKQWDPENKGWDASLSLIYPLFVGGKRYFETKTASTQEKKAAESFRSTKNSLKADSVRLYTNWVDRYKIIEVGEFYENSCKLQTDIAKRKYINGLITYEDWYSIEESYMKSQTDMLLYKQKEADAKIAWMKFLGEVSLKE
ncbi:MAG: TolC family protein [Endomicrobium sp.]|nr:TolC family protein [Endomicrobium sp.]